MIPYAGSPSKCPEQPELGQAKARGQELSLGFPCDWQGLKPSPFTSQGVYYKEAGIRNDPNTQLRYTGLPNSVLTTRPGVHHLPHFLKLTFVERMLCARK